MPAFPNDPKAKIPLESAPIWRNWSGDLEHKPASDGERYYFSPTNRDELAKVVRRANEAGVSLRVSGQRHSQTPLVIDDNREFTTPKAKNWLVDLSCYADLGDGNDQIELSKDRKTVRVNAGVREDYLDAFLTRNDLMLKTVTAGGFFSVGGMTAVDVHGASIDQPIVAETVSAFTIMGPDGEVTQLCEDDPEDEEVDGWRPIQFARVSLGALGIVTSVTIEVMERPYATTVAPGMETIVLKTPEDFIRKYKQLLAAHNRIESFFDPYKQGYTILWWDLVSDPDDQKKNIDRSVPDSCSFAEQDQFGSPYENKLFESFAQGSEGYIQLHGPKSLGEDLVQLALGEVKKLFKKSVETNEDLWLTQAARVAFMSYFVELPNLDDEGLRKVWDALHVLHVNAKTNTNFHPGAPLEFRFVRGGDSAMSGTYSTQPGSTFVNLDLIAFVPDKPADQYPPQILQFFADLEREWYGKQGGFPHNGKMYGFYDPADPGSITPPFELGFMKDLAERRGDRLRAFETYRRSRDPNGLFCNEFVREIGLCPEAEK